MTETPPNTRGEVFRVGDIVAPFADIPETVEDRGEITAIGDYGCFHTTVRWEGLTGDGAHIDRITLVAPGIFS